MGDVRKLAAEEYLIKEGDESNEMYYLNSGTMAVFISEDGSEKQVGTIYSGELVGEMSFLSGEPRSASVRAIGDCELTVIPKEKLRKTLEQQPNWYRALNKTLVERLKKANQRIKI